MPKYLITRTMAATHTLAVGIDAVSAEKALILAMGAHTDGCLREDFHLLEDYYDNDRTLIGFEAKKIDWFPKPGREVAYDAWHEKMKSVCEHLDNREYWPARVLAMQVLHDMAPDDSGEIDTPVRQIALNSWLCHLRGPDCARIDVEARDEDRRFDRPFRSAGTSVVDATDAEIAKAPTESIAILIADALNQYFKLNCDALQNPNKND